MCKVVRRERKVSSSREGERSLYRKIKVGPPSASQPDHPASADQEKGKKKSGVSLLLCTRYYCAAIFLVRVDVGMENFGVFTRARDPKSGSRLHRQVVK